MKIDDFIGEKSFIASQMKCEGQEPAPCLGDIRQLIKEYCVLPLGSEHVRTNSPLVRSILISGKFNTPNTSAI